MEGLRVELCGECLDPIGVDANPRTAAESLPRHQVVQVAKAHGHDVSSVRSDERIRVRHTSRISSANGESSGQARDKTKAPTAWANVSIIVCRLAPGSHGTGISPRLNAAKLLSMPPANVALMSSD